MQQIPLPDQSEAASQKAKESVRHGQSVAVLFRLGSEFLAVNASVVQEITFMARLSTPSGLPPMIAGFLNLAGRPIPVIRLDRLLSLPESKPGLYSQILILRDGVGPPVGWMVDGVTHIVPVRQEEVLPVPENHCFRDCAKGIFTVNDTSVSILAPDRVLLEKERRCMLDFQAREQERLSELEHAEP
jgi:purine-binding chemotaxis protein CheW